MIVVAALLAVVVTGVVVARPWQEVPPRMRSPEPPRTLRSVSVDFGVVTDPTTDWEALDARLDAAGATGVDLNAGRVEFTAFDWAEHPESAAEPGTDHLARAARALRLTADGEQRQIGLIVDAYVPRWIAQDPSVAGVDGDGNRVTYNPSATQLAQGPVGDRLVAYVAALGARYQPSQIALTELFLYHSWGDDDLALYRAATGAADWPRGEDGRPDGLDPTVGTWRSEVIADLLRRMRAALDEAGASGVALAMDVEVDWADPPRGVPSSGHEYAVLLRAADRLVLWAYTFAARPPSEVGTFTAALVAAGEDMSRFVLSVGLWAPASLDPPGALPASALAEAVGSAQTAGATHVNVTPASLLSDEDWAALTDLWR
ncbi:hypothetical protein [Cellulomonas iranensis]|uniref:Uncharacterized protein n=1 Tax=Cellulomonas iranensis TaxID=76862 RepID=A0ABU0GIH1_9CELL|nr:hypothetical protein [Cellulomonas iranensis]MDQ0425174.1 hypothetical protein [Cellulomonas iranensis]